MMQTIKGYNHYDSTCIKFKNRLNNMWYTTPTYHPNPSHRPLSLIWKSATVPFWSPYFCILTCSQSDHFKIKLQWVALHSKPILASHLPQSKAKNPYTSPAWSSSHCLSYHSHSFRPHEPLAIPQAGQALKSPSCQEFKGQHITEAHWDYPT